MLQVALVCKLDRYDSHNATPLLGSETLEQELSMFPIISFLPAECERISWMRMVRHWGLTDSKQHVEKCRTWTATAQDLYTRTALDCFDWSWCDTVPLYQSEVLELVEVWWIKLFALYFRTIKNHPVSGVQMIQVPVILFSDLVVAAFGRGERNQTLQQLLPHFEGEPMGRLKGWCEVIPTAFPVLARTQHVG